MTQRFLRFTEDEKAFKEEISRVKGRIVHQFSTSVFVVDLPDTTSPTNLKESTDQTTIPLDYATQLAVNAWIIYKTQGSEAPDATEGLNWDNPGFKAPLEHSATLNPPQGAVELSPDTPTSLYLTESVAVGLVLVSRDQGTETMNDEEKTKIIQEVQAGLDWLTTIEPRSRLSFVYDIRPITVNIVPGPYPGETDPYERFESGWRDAALQNMGYSPGRPGYQKYVKDLQTTKGTKWAYVAFFTKYPLKHFAYAIWEKVVMEYKNDNWGPNNIHRVFAHESCHIFGAVDEYGNCTCGGTNGHLGAPNNNCVNCIPPNEQQDCLMNQNTLSMCEWTRKQIGWDTRLFPSDG